MKTILWLSNHPCSEEQVEDCQRLFGQDCRIDELPPEGKALWAAVNPEWDFYDVGLNWLKAFSTVHSGNLSDYDAVVVMGELSLCLCVITECTISHVSAYTPTTERRSEEQVQSDGSVKKTNIFRHCQLRCLHLP